MDHLCLELCLGVLSMEDLTSKNIDSLRLNKWPKELDGLKIIHISDLHLGVYVNKPIKDVVELINNEEPDIIVFTGDLINNSYWEADDFISDLAQLKARHGKYAILGNHDYGDYLGIDKNTQSGMNKWQSNFNKMIAIHDKIGFDLLLNENRKIEINGSLLILSVLKIGALVDLLSMEILTNQFA